MKFKGNTPEAKTILGQRYPRFFLI